MIQMQFKPTLSQRLFLRDPEHSDVGKQIVRAAIKLLQELGYEHFTFKKLALEINSTEATVYRYFENKHKLLIYLIDWYWSFMEFQIIFHTNNLTNPADKIRKAIDLLIWEDNINSIYCELDQQALYYIAIAESSKTYLSKEVNENNKEMLYKPYKDLCATLANIFIAYNPAYLYPNSLASSIIEMSHYQYYFMHHLPRLCDFSATKNPKDIEVFLEGIVFGTLGKQ